MADPHNFNRYLATALVACAVATSSQAEELTIDRLFDTPSLGGPTIIGLKISPDGKRITYLQGKADNKDRLDLWEYDIRERHSRILIDSRVGGLPSFINRFRLIGALRKTKNICATQNSRPQRQL
jgi:hypothetical protein